MPAAQADVGETIHNLRRQIEEKALLLSELEVVLEDCQKERQVLLHDLRALKERLWDLRDAPPGPRSGPAVGLRLRY